MLRSWEEAFEFFLFFCAFSFFSLSLSLLMPFMNALQELEMAVGVASLAASASDSAKNSSRSVLRCARWRFLSASSLTIVSVSSDFFWAWEIRGLFPKVLSHPKYGQTATTLFEDAQKLLEEIIKIIN